MESQLEPRVVVFRRQDLELFARLSGDLNPLHLDPVYARRTPFGRCIVHGILGVLAVLGEALGDRPIELRNVSVKFLKPLWLDVPYIVRIESFDGAHLVASLGTPDAPRLRLELEATPAPGRWPLRACPRLASQRLEPADRDPLELLAAEGIVTGRYAIVPDALRDLSRRLRFDPSILPARQLTALLWTSYLVGMELPGQQAVFRSLLLEMAGGRGADGALAFDARVDGYQPETSTLVISAALSSDEGPFAKALMTAARRPRPVEPSLPALAAKLGRSTALDGKRALVTGSSRGLGALVALGCALHGADVILHCKDGTAEAESVASTVASLGRSATIVSGDVRHCETWDELRDTALSLGGIDAFVHNASPAPVALPHAELSEEVVDGFICEGIRASTRALRAFLPLLAARGGAVVNVSAAAVRKPTRELAHEVTVKAAVEGLVHALAAELRSIRFITVRPPRLHTDRTNDIIPAFRGRPAEDVAAGIVRALLEPRGASNHQVLDAFD